MYVWIRVMLLVIKKKRQRKEGGKEESHRENKCPVMGLKCLRGP